MNKIIDASRPTTALLHGFKADGVGTIIRYIASSSLSGKRIEAPEARAIAATGIKLALVFENYGGVDGFAHHDINAVSGRDHGRIAREWAEHVGAPPGTLIWFAIDTDVSGPQFSSFVRPYFESVRAALGDRYRPGIYGCGYACALALDEKLADAAWLSQSMGWHGSKAFRDGRRWALLQGAERNLYGLSVDANEANPGHDIGAFVPFAPAAEPAGTSESGQASASAGNEARPEPGGEGPGSPPPSGTPQGENSTGGAPATIAGLPPRIVAEIVTRAVNSPVIGHSWRGRGVAPRGYVKGMAVAFGACLAAWQAAALPEFGMGVPSSGHDEADALAWYQGRFEDAGLGSGAPEGPDTIRRLFVLLLGLGMRESSGRYCEGRDRSAHNVTADTAEAGLFQMSWNARSAQPPVFDELLISSHNASDQEQTLLAIFKEGVSPHAHDLEVYGDGAGALYQMVAKSNPLFAVRAAGIGLRVIRKHWGPINRHEAEVLPEADALFRQVQELVFPATPPALA